MISPTLYQRVLDEDFAKLPPILQRFHGSPTGGCAAGTIKVEHGAGRLRGLAAFLLRLPGAGGAVSLRLQVIPHDGKELWIRHFGRQCVNTLQWQEGACLVEKAGPIQLVFRLAADADGLTFHLLHNKTLGMRLPAGLSMRVDAHARGMEDRWRIEVVISAPQLGMIAAYRGEIVPQFQ
jgi:hypothetical protein